jgi:hypothetical protein
MLATALISDTMSAKGPDRRPEAAPSAVLTESINLRQFHQTFERAEEVNERICSLHFQVELAEQRSQTQSFSEANQTKIHIHIPHPPNTI